jgi:hypothetical protein
MLYGGYVPAPSNYYKNFRDITSGSAGVFSAGLSWDFVTGIGSSLGLQGQ